MDNARFISSLNSSSSYANPPPVPPRVNADGELLKAYLLAISTRALRYLQSDWITGSPRLRKAPWKVSLSSARLMLLFLVPRSSTRHSLSTLLLLESIARLRPVCPPMPGRIASGLVSDYPSCDTESKWPMYTFVFAIDVSVMVAGLLQSTTIPFFSMQYVPVCPRSRTQPPDRLR